MKKLFLFFTFILLIVSGYRGLSSNPELETIRERVISGLMQPEVDDKQITNLIETLKDDGSWPGIDYEDVSRTGFDNANHTSNMVVMARAYNKSDSEYYKSQKLKGAVESALSFWIKHDFISDNWWHNQIGTPRKMVDLMLLMGYDLPEEIVEGAQPIIGRASIDPVEGKFWGARPGGDRIKIAAIEGKNFLFHDNGEEFRDVVEVIEEEIKFRTGKRGMQQDFSFHHRHDRVNNTLSYGLGYANAFAKWAAYVAGTRYAFSEDKLERLIDYYLDGICKMMVYGKYPDPGAKNRSVSRKGTLSPYGTEIPEKLLKTSGYRSQELDEIVKIRKGEIEPSLSHSTFFWHSEYYSHQRPEYFASVRMFSSRNHNMEEPYNSEGLMNHHLGDGSNFVSISGREYFDIFPVFDWQKIPGTTAMQKPELPPASEIQKPGRFDFVGGVTNGQMGAAVFDFKSPHDPLEAQKSWFFFEDEYICLGAGINGRRNLPVVTTLNQHWLDGNVSAKAGNRKTVVTKGTHEMEEVQWVYHDGIGYLFPEPVQVNLSNQVQTGSWFKINKQSDSPKEKISKDVFKLWLDHGEQPRDETYAYMVVPAITEQEIPDDFQDRNVEIVTNTTKVQAVKHTGLNILQAVFYTSGKLQISEDNKITMDSPGLLMIETEDDSIKKITVSDPSRKLRRLHFSVSEKVDKKGKHFSAAWNPHKEWTEITIDLPQSEHAGESVTIVI